MYCPRCTKEFEPGTAFCRTCGLPLDQVAAIVNGERDTEPEVKTSPNRNLMRYGMGVFILGLVIALGNAILKDFGLFPEAIGKYIFLSLVMVGMGLIGAGVVFPQKRYVKRKGRAPRNVELQEALATANLDRLPSADRSIDDFTLSTNSREPDSVTDHTTRQLV
jgi:hypothetical protein